MAGLLVANLVSVAGGRLSVVALPWFVLVITGSTVATGLAAVCETVPIVACSLVAGVVVERVGALAVRVGSDVVSAVTVLAIPVLHATVGVQFWQLLVLVAVNGAVRAPAPAASLVLLNALSCAAGTSGDRARAAYSGGIRLASVAGAPVAGALIAWRGAPAALVVDAASFAVSALVVAAIVRRVPLAAAHPSRAMGWQRPWAGLVVMARDRVLAVISVLVVLVAVLSGAWDSVLAPAYGQQILHSATALGVLLGVFSVGALVGNAIYPVVADRVTHHLLVWACLGTETVLGYGALALTHAVPVLAGCQLVAGIAVGLLTPLWLGLLTTQVAEPHHGHVFGVAVALEQAGGAAGAMTAGFAVTHLGMTATLLAAATGGAALALAAAAAPPLRTMHPNAAAVSSQPPDG